MACNHAYFVITLWLHFKTDSENILNCLKLIVYYTKPMLQL